MVRLPGTSEEEYQEQTEDTEARRDMRIVIVEVVTVFILGMILAMMSFRERVPAPVPTVTPTITPSPTFTPTPSPTPTFTPTPTPTPTFTPTPTPVCVVKQVEKGHPFKPMTGFWAYNAKGTAQNRLQKVARSDERTGIRIVTDPYGDDRYCVALGTYWAGAHPEHIGRCLDVVMVNGAVLKCVLADVKRQEHTKGQRNRYGLDNNDILEFIVDERYLPSGVYGDMSAAGPEFEGDVSHMIIYDFWIEGFGNGS